MLCGALCSSADGAGVQVDRRCVGAYEQEDGGAECDQSDQHVCLRLARRPLGRLAAGRQRQAPLVASELQLP